jgi:hypothetical protein
LFAFKLLILTLEDLPVYTDAELSLVFTLPFKKEIGVLEKEVEPVYSTSLTILLKHATATALQANLLDRLW